MVAVLLSTIAVESISGVRTIKLAVRLAIFEPVDVKLLMSATGSTLALRMAMIISDGRDDEDDDAVDGSGRAAAADAVSHGTSVSSID